MVLVTGGKRKGFDQKKGVRKLARERVGTVPPSRPIEPKDKRRKPKHPRPPGEEGEGGVLARCGASPPHSRGRAVRRGSGALPH